MNTTKRTSIVLLSLSLVFFTVAAVIIFLLSNDAVANSISNWRAGSDKNILWHIKNEGYADNKSGYTGFMAYVIIAMFLRVFIAITGVTLIVNSSKENNKIGIFAGITGIIMVPLSVVFAGITLALKTKHVEEVVEEQPNSAVDVSLENNEVVEPSIEDAAVAIPEEIKEQPKKVDEKIAIVEEIQNNESEIQQVDESEPTKKSWWKDKKKKKENESSTDNSTTAVEVSDEAKPAVEAKEAIVEAPIEIAKEVDNTPVIATPVEEPIKKEKAGKTKVVKSSEQPKTQEAVVAPVENTQPTPEVPVQQAEVPVQPVQETPAPVEIQNQQQVPLEQYQDPTQQVANAFIDSPESIQAKNALGDERTKSIEVFAADLIPKINPNATEEQISQTITQQLFVKQVVGYDPNKESPEQVLSMVQKVVDNVVKKFISSPEKKGNASPVARAPQTQSQTRRPMMTQPKRR